MSTSTVSCQVALDLTDQRLVVKADGAGNVTLEATGHGGYASLTLSERELEQFADLQTELLEWIASQSYRAAATEVRT